MWLLLSILFAIVATMLIVSGMGLLLKGMVPSDYILTGFVASLFVSLAVSLLLIRLARQQTALMVSQVTASKNDELIRALRKEENAFSAIFEESPVPYALNDPQGNITHLNAAFVRTFGYTQEDIPTLEDWWPKAYPDTEYRTCVSATWKARFEAHRKTGSPFEPMEVDIRCKDGSIRTAMVSVTSTAGLVRDLDLVVLYDVTERKKATALAHEDVERYRRLIDSAPFPVVVTDIAVNNLLYANPRAEELFGASLKDNAGLSTSRFFTDPELHNNLRSTGIEQLRAGRKNLEYEAQMHTANGGDIWALLSMAYIEFDGKPALITSISDITIHKLAAESMQQSALRYRSLIEAAPFPVIVAGVESGTILFGNQRAAALFGLDREQGIGRTTADFYVDPSDRTALLESLAQNGSVLDHEVELRKADGSTLWALLSVAAFEFDGKPALLTSINDITERKAAEEKLKLSARVFSEAHEGILITDADSIIVDVNPTFCEITGYDRDEIIGQNPSMLKSGRQSPEFYATMWKDLSEQGFWRGELWNRKKDGTLYAELLSISALRDESGNVRYYIGMLSDITQSKQQQQKLEMLAHYDALTHLPNRMLFADRFGQAIARCKRDNISLLAVCYLDLDGFKQVNDTLGHDAGDRLLVQVAERIKSMLREEDTVSRLGGDEFALLLGDIKTLDQCEQALERIHRTIAQPYLLDEQSVTIGASSGIAIYPLDDADPDTLLRHADQAMYEAKLAGRNRFHLFDAAHDQQLQQQRIKLESIEHALKKNEFHLYYQPKVNMRTGEVFGAEALIRWLHPERGIIPPLEFLPVVEGTPLEIALGDWVIHEALSQLDAWRKSGLEIQVSVNISPMHLQEKNFFPSLDAALAKYPDTLSSQFEIEVLESSAVEDLAAMGEVLNACRRALGINVALDDFGTGYSSLTHLRRLPANMIKVDQSFVRDMIDDPDDYAIVEGVVGLAHAFRRQAIAEGVETSEHGLMLLAIGCHLAQGYAIARPMPADSLEQWIKEQQPHLPWIAYARQFHTSAETSIMLLQIEGRQWLKRLETCLQSPTGSTPHWPVMRHDACHCGRWVLRARKEETFPQGLLDRLDTTHQKMHQIGNALMRQHLDGQIEAVRSQFPSLHLIYREIEDILDEMARTTPSTPESVLEE